MTDSIVDAYAPKQTSPSSDVTDAYVPTVPNKSDAVDAYIPKVPSQVTDRIVDAYTPKGGGTPPTSSQPPVLAQGPPTTDTIHYPSSAPPASSSGSGPSPLPPSFPKGPISPTTPNPEVPQGGELPKGLGDVLTNIGIALAGFSGGGSEGSSGTSSLGASNPLLANTTLQAPRISRSPAGIVSVSAQKADISDSTKSAPDLANAVKIKLNSGPLPSGSRSGGVEKGSLVVGQSGDSANSVSTTTRSTDSANVKNEYAQTPTLGQTNSADKLAQQPVSQSGLSGAADRLQTGLPQLGNAVAQFGAQATLLQPGVTSSQFGQLPNVFDQFGTQVSLPSGVNVGQAIGQLAGPVGQVGAQIGAVIAQQISANVASQVVAQSGVAQEALANAAAMSGLMAKKPQEFASKLKLKDKPLHEVFIEQLEEEKREKEQKEREQKEQQQEA